ncbi:hypothetical protein FKM82_016710 [Ascaphus truei]
MDRTLEDLPLITEETFDFEPCSPSDSYGDDDDSVPLACTSQLHVARPLDMNVAGEVSLVLRWSPLSAQGMEEITKEANRLAWELEKENESIADGHYLYTAGTSFPGYQLKPAGISARDTHQTGDISYLVHQTEDLSLGHQLKMVGTSYHGHWREGTSSPRLQLHTADIAMPAGITSPGHRSLLLPDNTSSPRSPRRETYVIRDSPIRSLLPNLDLLPPPKGVIMPGRDAARVQSKAGGGGSKFTLRKGQRERGERSGPGRHSRGTACSVKATRIMQNPTGKSWSGKVPLISLPSRPTGIPALTSRLPVPKPCPTGPRLPTGTRPTNPRVHSGSVRLPAQRGENREPLHKMQHVSIRGSLMRPPTRLAAPIKTLLPGFPR